MEKSQSVSEFLLENFKERQNTARESSQKLLLEGLYSYKTLREANFVHVRVYDLFLVLRYLDNEKRDETTSKGSHFDGSSDVIVQVEEYLFLPAIKLILNEQNPAKPFLQLKYQNRKFEIYPVQNQGKISALWDSLRKRCILYVSPSKVPSSSKSLKREVQRADRSEVSNLSRFIFDYFCFGELRRSLPKVNFVYETSNLAGITFKAAEIAQTAGEGLLSKSLTIKETLRGILRLLLSIQEVGYWPKTLSLALFGVSREGRLVVSDIAGIIRQAQTGVGPIIEDVKDVMAEASLLSKADLDLLQRLLGALQAGVGLAALISQI